MILFIGGPEIIIILLFIIMFFGSKKIPEIARGIGKGIREVKDASKARVRVVDAIPKHLSGENKDSVYISVWLKQ